MSRVGGADEEYLGRVVQEVNASYTKDNMDNNMAILFCAMCTNTNYKNGKVPGILPPSLLLTAFKELWLASDIINTFNASSTW